MFLFNIIAVKHSFEFATREEVDTNRSNSEKFRFLQGEAKVEWGEREASKESYGQNDSGTLV